MSPHNLQTSVLALVVACTFTACGSGESTDRARDESFLALMGSDDGKADRLVVSEGSVEARAVLEVVNTLTFDALEGDVGLQRRLVANLIAHRDGNGSDPIDDDPYDSLAELDATPWTTMDAFRHIFEHAHAHGFVDALRSPATCSVDADCGATGFCHFDRCYDVSTVDHGLAEADSFDVGSDGEWWVRSHSGGSTVRDARGSVDVHSVGTQTYDDADLEPWLAKLHDGSLTSVTRSGNTVIPEFGAPVVLGDFARAVDAAFDGDGTLFVAAAAIDAHARVKGVVVLRRSEAGWQEELKQPFDSGDSEHLTAAFARDDDGQLQLWVDVDTAARRFSRRADGQWRESMVLDMFDAGFGERPADRTVHFKSAADGTVLVHRATWKFARHHEVVRIDGNMMTAVIDLPTAARSISPHPDGHFTILYADGSLGYVDGGVPRHGESTPLEPSQPGDIVRTNGESIYVLQGDSLHILHPRERR